MNLRHMDIFSNPGQCCYRLRVIQLSRYLECRDLKDRYRMAINRCNHRQFSLKRSFSSSFSHYPVSHILHSRNSKYISKNLDYIHRMCRFKLFMSLFKPWSIPHKRLLNSCPWEKNSRGELGISVFIHIGVDFLKLVESFILGRCGRCTSIAYYSHHSAVILCSWVGKLSNFRVKFWNEIRSLFISTVTPDLLSITSAANCMVTRV